MLKNLRKSLLLCTLLSFFSVSNAIAGDLYWVGNNGAWTDASHWSSTSGGAGGIGVPTQNDNAIFDANSFNLVNSFVTINSNISINNLIIKQNSPYFTLSSSPLNQITIYGIVDIKGVFSNEIKSSIYFKNNHNSIHELYFGWYKWKANFYFDGVGTYVFKSPLQTHDNDIALIGGTINLNHFDVLCSSFISNSNQKRKLISNGSAILAFNFWKTSQVKFNYNFSQTRIYVISSATSAIDKGGDNYTIKQSGKGNNNKTISNFSIAKDDTVSCGNTCDGSLTVNFTTDCPNGFVDWLPGSGVDLYTGECFACPIAGPNCSNTITGLCPGNYTAVLTNDCDASVAAPQAVVNGHPPIVPLVQNMVQPTCNGVCDGSASIVVTGAPFANFTYLWLGQGPGDTLTTLSNLCAGLYQIEVRDGFGCVDTFNFNVTQPDSIYANVTVTDPLCFGYCSGSAISNPVGGVGPYSYSWSPPTGNPAIDTAQSFPNLCAGTNYTVVVTDAQGCSNDTTFAPTEPPQLQIDSLSTMVTCGGACDGTITVTVLSGGVPPYTHNWNGGPVVNGPVSIRNALCPGTYTDTIRDANGCDTVYTFTITEPTILTTSTTFTDLTCNGICNGTAKTTPAGGAGGYTYVWAAIPVQPFSGQGSDSIFNLCPGQYYVIVTDANNCTTSDTITISEPPPIIINPSSTNVTCPGFCDGTATSSPT